KSYRRSHDAVIRVDDDACESFKRAGKLASLKSSKNRLELSEDRINYGVHGPSCALHNAVRHILSCIRGALRDVGCRVDWASLDSANREGRRENDRKERFHST